MTIAIYILLGLLIAALEFRRHSTGSPIDAMTAFNCFYFVLFVFVPINVICLGADVVRQQYAYETFGQGNAYTALSLLLCYVLFCLGYSLKPSNRSQSAVRGPQDCFSLKTSTHVAKIIFFFGVLVTAAYVVQMGGILNVIARASEVRSGELVIESKYIGYRHFAQFSADAFVLFCVVLIGKKTEKVKITKTDRIFLLWTFVFFVYYALSTAGRRPFIYPILLCYLVFSSMGGRVKKVAIVAFALIFLIAGLGSMIGAMDSVDNLPVLVEMARDNDASLPALFTIAYDNASQGLADSFIHFVGAQKASLWQFGFLTDIVNLPGDFLPSQLLGFERSSHMYGEVTEFFLGHALDDGISGEETLGLHGYLLVNFGYVGMFALFFLLGLLYKWLHIRLKPAAPKDAVGWLIYWWVVLAFFVYFREGVLIFVLKQQLTWWVTIMLLAHYQAKQIAKVKSGAAVESIDGLGATQTT
jgi:hypothetical protein